MKKEINTGVSCSSSGCDGFVVEVFEGVHNEKESKTYGLRPSFKRTAKSVKHFCNVCKIIHAFNETKDKKRLQDVAYEIFAPEKVINKDFEYHGKKFKKGDIVYLIPEMSSPEKTVLSGCSKTTFFVLVDGVVFSNDDNEHEIITRSPKKDSEHIVVPKKYLK